MEKSLFPHPADVALDVALDEMAGTRPDLFRFADVRNAVDPSD